MTFQTEFPDFPAADMPAIPAGWEDASWHNNSAPSFIAPGGFNVWIDYLDPANREFDGGKRFLVNKLDADGCFTNDDPDLETDDWSEVLAFIAERSNGQ
jgi:hypothetical protein